MIDGPLQAIAGVPESALDDATAAKLPPAAPPAPWPAVADAVVWLHRAAPGATLLQLGDLRGRPAIPLTVGAFIRYRETPVGPYDEILAAPVVLAERPLPAATVPFIAVDSLASLRGGREQWALPKTLARFTFAGDTARAEGDGWSVAARVRARPRELPVALALRDRQPLPGGGSALVDIRLRGRARLGRVAVTAEGPELPSWLLPGPHPALVIRGGRMTFGAPRG
ncbi:MAG TPA: acetoacetate decarboxylase family protein [Capillimicrobium sp.]|nr:acetoacetate decarboxylase family protein [Capillimicrobium sp.]